MNMIIKTWNQTWELRQAIRFAINGYDISMVMKLAVMTIREIRYK